MGTSILSISCRVRVLLLMRHCSIQTTLHFYSMAEIFGAVAAGIGVGSELIRLGCAIQKRIKRVKDSRKDIERLANETIIFAGLYKRFLRACEEDPDAYTTDVSAILPLISWAQKTVDSLTTLLQRVESLYPQSKPRTDFEDRAVAHLVWYRSTSTVKALRASLSVARESINGFSNLMCLEKLKDQLKTLRKALLDPHKRSALERDLGISVEARILELDQDIVDSEVVHHESMKMRDQAEQKVTKYREKSQTSDEVPAPQELAKFTEILNHHARSLLPSRQRKHRSHVSSSGSSASITESTHSIPSQVSQPLSFRSSDSGKTHPNNGAVLGFKVSRPTPGSISSRAVQPPTPRYRLSSSVPLAYYGTPDNIVPLNIPRTANPKERVSSPTESMEASPLAGTAPSRNPVAAPSSATHNFVTPGPVSEPRTSGTDSFRPMPITGQIPERYGMRPREYINDPNGNILSPPKVKGEDTSSSQQREERVGRHVIRLNATDITINGHSLHMANYEMGQQFFKSLLKHHDKLDRLDEALGQGLENWEGIPDWWVMPNTDAENRDM
ncbi:hypothetical protein C7974DRAFT_45351 [Boeremia exigua]|uniref:uncharacterized protein n=1 Tax=Boeremia exigua TaxID=749465 RepID=UPI001E8D2F70|nr:uncharacterized protein C7974DRAFT_45351 [Boeremia exigua]KAH6616470.1 hypothetical protein C7974DRAFT_45351 [Boeremia exigua]